jgi:hypothetical protein
MPKLETRNSKLVTTNSVELTRVRDFKDLLVWKLARPLRIQVYELLKKLPVDERFALWSQGERFNRLTLTSLKDSGGTPFRRTFHSAAKPEDQRAKLEIIWLLRQTLVLSANSSLRRRTHPTSDTVPQRLHPGNITETASIEGKVCGVKIFEFRF